MSYEKVKNIRIDEKQGKVFINCACNNVRPLSYTTEEYPYFSKILKEKGKQEVEIELLKGYDCGNLQEGNNKYSKAFKVLLYVFGEEYNKFNWRTNWKESKKREENQEFKNLLIKALNYKFPKDKFVITKKYGNEKIYAKVNKTCIKWLYTPEKSTKFNFEKEAKNNIFEKFKDEWKVEKIK